MARVEVVGASMRPTLEAGDRLWVLPLRPRPGDIVAVRDPRARKRVLVKRVLEVVDGGASVVVGGDAPDDSTDSRTFGPVPGDDVIGRAVYRYAPRYRIGWLRQSGQPRPDQ